MAAFAENSEIKLLKVLSENSFLFYELYDRKAIQPVFKEIIFGAVAKFRYLLVAGDRSDWSEENAANWRKV